MSDRPRGERRPRPSDEEGAERLFARVRAACVGHEDLPARVEAGLRATLEMLSGDPDLARRLTVDPYLDADEEVLDAQRRWIGRFGDLLREAAAGDPRAATWPSFIAPFLIGSVRHRIGRLVLNGEAADLPRLLPDSLEALLAYYYEPNESRRLAQAALRGEC